MQNAELRLKLTAAILHLALNIQHLRSISLASRPHSRIHG